MQSDNIKIIQKAFTQQSHNFESDKMNFTRQEYLDYSIEKIAPSKTDVVLEVAAGTCICGRAMSPYVRHVTCLDMTPAMLAVGKDESEKDKLNNITFVKGDAMELPFLRDSFDIVFSRLAFHHFEDVRLAFQEMKRVLKPGGKLIIIDMEAAEEDLREKQDFIEKMRDVSHVKNISRKEFLSLYEQNGLKVECCEVKNIPVRFKNWMEHTETPEDVQRVITLQMEADIKGGCKTGFYPYKRNSQIWFNHRWLLIIGKL